MSKIFATAALFAALVSQATAHTAVEEIEVGGVSYKGFYGDSIDAPLPKGSPAWKTAQGTGYQPIFGNEIGNPDIIAHKNAEPSPNTAEAPAGSKVIFHWAHTGSCGAGDEVGWDCSHHGWTTTYLAPCPGDCANVDKNTLEFFKIDQLALIDYPEGTRYAQGDRPQGYTGRWATDKIFYEDDNTYTVTIPSEIPSGNYVLRTEVASIHNNQGLKDRQIWPQAFNIKVTGGKDGAEMPAGKKGIELYSPEDPLLTWDLYEHAANKVFPSAPGPQIASVAVAANVNLRRHARDFSS